jgi:hypothetical protein
MMNKSAWSIGSYLWTIFFFPLVILAWKIWAMDSSTQAAWVQAIGTISALFVAIYIPYHNDQMEKEKKKNENKKLVKSAAAILAKSLAHAEIVFRYAPEGDGKIGHDTKTPAEAKNFLLFEQETREAAKLAVEKSHLFDERLQDEIIRLDIYIEAHNRMVEDYSRFFRGDSNEFLREMADTKNKAYKHVAQVRNLLAPYLPNEA